MCIGTDDAAIYSAALDSLVHTGRVIILTDSGPHLPSLACKEALSGVRSRLPVHVVPYSAVSPSTMGKGTDYWTEFSKKFPYADGWYAFSQIRHTDSNYAALTYSHRCGWLCGDGGTVEVTRDASRWKVIKIEVYWMN